MRRLSLVGAAAPLVVAILTATAAMAPAATVPPAAAAPAAPAAAARPAAAPSFLRAVTAGHAGLTGAGAVSGVRRLVDLDTSLLPNAAGGQTVSFDLGTGTTVTGTVTHVDHTADSTAWTGSTDQDLGSFTIVRAGDVYRGSLTSPQGVWSITHAGDDLYWLTAVAPYAGPSGAEAADELPAAASSARSAVRPSARQAAKKKGKVRIDVLFGYTKGAKATAGSKANLKADVALAIADTNLALANSGLKVKVRSKGLVKTKGTEKPNILKDLVRLRDPHDGVYDNLLPARARKHADIVHLFTAGNPGELCGAGVQAESPSRSIVATGASMSYVTCLPYLVTTHELGHNMGADHNKYPNVSHFSRLPYAYGYNDPARNFISVMSYYEPCTDQGIYTCVRIPYFSNPTGTYNGAPVGTKAQNNAKAIKKIAPVISRLAR